jgi:hypothetical protein
MGLTKEQRAAISRANGAKSRGPKTIEGKAISSRNALKTGLTAKKFIIPELESEAELHRFSLYMRKHYQPQNIEEALWVDRITAVLWRLRRLNLEMTLRASQHNERHSYVTASYCGNLDDLDKLTIIEERLCKQLQQAIKELDKVRTASQHTPLPRPSEEIGILINHSEEES